MSISARSILVGDRRVYIGTDLTIPLEDGEAASPQPSSAATADALTDNRPTICTLVGNADEFAALSELLARAEHDTRDDAPVLALTGQLSAVVELEQQLQQATALAQGVRVALQNHLATAAAVVQQQQTDISRLRSRLRDVERQLDALDGLAPHEPPARTDTSATVTSSDQPIMVETNLTSVIATLRTPGSAERRLVSLPADTPVGPVRRLLPPGWSLQPDTDFATDLVLIYRLESSAATAPALRCAYLLIDLLASFHSSGLLSSSVQARFQQSLPMVVRLLGPIGVQIQARACWRRAAPIRGLDIALPDLSLTQRSNLVRLLRAIAAKIPGLIDPLERAVRLFGPDAGLEACESFDGSTVFAAAHTTVETDDSEQFDMDRITRRREETLRAQETLRSLEESNAEIDEQHENTALAGPSTTATLSPQEWQFARRVAGQDQYTLGEIRMIARECGLVPLDAVRAVNDWAEQQAETTGRTIDVMMIEIAEHHDTVWVDDMLQELL